MPLPINKKQFRGALATVFAIGAAALAPSVAHAQLYAIYQDIWRIDISGATSTATKVKDFTGSDWTPFTAGGSDGYGNSLAVDTVHNQLLFGDAASLSFRSYNLSTGTVSSLGTLAVAGYDLTGYSFGGSASFYNGKYYVMPELAAAANATATKPWNFLIEVTLNGAGTGIASTKIIGGTTDSPNRDWTSSTGQTYTNGFGDGGDVAIDKNGKIYGFSSAVANPTGVTTGQISGFYTGNINTPTGSINIVDSSVARTQTALQNGTLYTNNGVASIQSRNLTTGAVTNTYTLSGYTETVMADLAGAVDTPEPGSASLLLSAGALPLGGLFLRLRRTARKAAPAA